MINIGNRVKIKDSKSKYYGCEGKVFKITEDKSKVIVDLKNKSKLTIDASKLEKYFIIGDIVETIYGDYGVIQQIKKDHNKNIVSYNVGLFNVELKIVNYTVEELNMADKHISNNNSNSSIKGEEKTFNLKQEPLKYESVNHPSHYHPGDYEAIKVIEAWLGKEGCYQFCLGNAIKYISRLDGKPSANKSKDEKTVEDIKKAIWYLDYAKDMKK